MPNLMPADVVKNFPDVYGYVIKKEKEEQITVKGIEMKIKRYISPLKITGIRVSLIDNTGLFFIKFNELLCSLESIRPADEKATGMYSYTTMTTADLGLDTFEGAFFYVYQNHIIFNEEEKSATPSMRLDQFVIYYKQKFGIRTHLKEDEFSSLDMLER